ncbi:small ribosomal subunit protein eS10x-like isoform X1 [Nicotiana tabacum]|uniref:Small ribosomal subunit protein eS10x-like isoform X1 n=1 Tax=Nicotiana tabacum TaxID=4097 RepID=A0AC58SPK2_TOBAC
MIIPEKNRREISKYLFQEGVCFAKKDYNLAKHPNIDAPNLQVIKLMQSFKSKEYVRETFAWMHYYWYLTNDGIEFLRTYLNLPSEIVPATLKKSAKPLGRPMGGPPGDRLDHLGLREIGQGLVTGKVIVLVQEAPPVSLEATRVELQLTTSLHSGVVVEDLDSGVGQEVSVVHPLAQASLKVIISLL